MKESTSIKTMFENADQEVLMLLDRATHGVLHGSIIGLSISFAYEDGTISTEKAGEFDMIEIKNQDLEGISIVPDSKDLEDNFTMPALWALGHMPLDWGPLPGVGSNWGWLLENGYIERNTERGIHFEKIRITDKGISILSVRPPGKAALFAAGVSVDT